MEDPILGFTMGDNNWAQFKPYSRLSYGDKTNPDILLEFKLLCTPTLSYTSDECGRKYGQTCTECTAAKCTTHTEKDPWWTKFIAS